MGSVASMTTKKHEVPQRCRLDPRQHYLSEKGLEISMPPLAADQNFLVSDHAGLGMLGLTHNQRLPDAG